MHPSQEDEQRKCKLKRLVQSPNSYFMDVKCPGCSKITTVFSPPRLWFCVLDAPLYCAIQQEEKPDKQRGASSGESSTEIVSVISNVKINMCKVKNKQKTNNKKSKQMLWAEPGNKINIL